MRRWFAVWAGSLVASVPSGVMLGYLLHRRNLR